MTGAHWLLAYVAAMSLALMGMMGADKRRARKGRRRISERRLLFAALLGGAAGGWIGMRLFRHKTKHRMFARGLPFLTMLHLALIAAAYGLAAR
jgi:uncharacterized membrane protein YsdA (DUF1294 family)